MCAEWICTPVNPDSRATLATKVNFLIISLISVGVNAFGFPNFLPGILKGTDEGAFGEVLISPGVCLPAWDTLHPQVCVVPGAFFCPFF